MIVRTQMLKILLGRDLLRLLKNPSAIMLLGLLMAISLLIATSRPKAPPPLRCWIVYWHQNDWIEHLKAVGKDPLEAMYDDIGSSDSEC